MIALIAQFKDPKGTIMILQPPQPKKEWKMEIVYKIETMVSSFTTFGCTVIDNPD